MCALGFENDSGATALQLTLTRMIVPTGTSKARLPRMAIVVKHPAQKKSPTTSMPRLTDQEIITPVPTAPMLAFQAIRPSVSTAFVDNFTGERALDPIMPATS